MRKWQLIIGVSFLTAGCASVEPVRYAGENADDPVEVITVTSRSAWPGIFFEDDRPPNLFTKKLPIAVILIQSASGWKPDSRCRIDTGDFEPHITRSLEKRGAEVRAKGPAFLLLDVDVSLMDAPKKTTTSEVLDSCYMTLAIRLIGYSKQRVAWAPEKEFTAETEFFEHSVVYRLQPENMRAEFEKAIDRDLDLIEPLLLGQEGGPE